MSRCSTLSVRFIYLLVLAALVMVIGCHGGTQPLVPPSSEFELEIVGAKLYPEAEFGLEYAFSHGFTRVDINGSTYRYVSPGLIFRGPQKAPFPPYVVVLDQRVSPWVPRLLRSAMSNPTLHVMERTSGKELAMFTLPRDGWPGDQAGRWLAGILGTDGSGGRNHEFNVSTAAHVEAIPPTSVMHPEDLRAPGLRLTGCPKDVLAYYDRKSEHGRAELRTPNWNLLMPDGIKEVYCSRQAILLFMSRLQEDLGIVALDSNGVVTGRGFVRNDKIDLAFRFHLTSIVEIDDTDEQLIVRQAHFVADTPFVRPKVAAYEAIFTIPWSALKMPR